MEAGMVRYGVDYRKRMDDPEEKRLYQQEQLLFDATELISKLMEKEGVSRSDLAKRIGKSKAYVTQVLRGQSNMTLRTLSDLSYALGYAVALGASNPSRTEWVDVGPWQGSMATMVYRRICPVVPTGAEPAPPSGPFECNNALAQAA
jgi:hypothetical protein